MTVTPHAGVWIEMDKQREREELKKVTPHAGVWIEIYNRPTFQL